MTKQSSKYKSAPMARHYSLDCRATLAMTLFLSSIFLNFITLSLIHSLTNKNNHRRLLDGGYSLPSGIPRNCFDALIQTRGCPRIMQRAQQTTFLRCRRRP